ncbi:MAG: response regulator transcription factor [Anaerolineae bacterium]|nr:response regulator transcription factor [Anaerolineae bacterium]
MMERKPGTGPVQLSSKARILLVDDEPSLRLFLADELRLYGYQVTALSSGEKALTWLGQNQADVLILDLQMTGMNGLQVMAELENQPLPPAIIMLTAHGSLDAAVAAMRRGGCDFLSKPCQPDELLAAIERGLAQRRKEQQRETMLQLIEQTAHHLQALSVQEPATQMVTPASTLFEGRGLLVDLEHQTVTKRGHPISLSPSEFRLLVCLIARSDRPVTFHEMVLHVHGVDEAETVARESMRTVLWRLRKKLGQADDRKPYIVNVHGRGYMFIKN